METGDGRRAGPTVATPRIAVVTGGGSGIGRALALGLLRASHHVILVGRRKELLEETIRAGGVPNGMTAVSCDLRQDESIKGFLKDVKSRFARLDALVHAAGIIKVALIEAAKTEDLDLMYQVNLRAPWMLTQGLLPELRASGGQIVFMNSSMGVSTKPAAGQYAATKHALRAFADTLRQEVNPDGIRVLSVYLGKTATPMQQALHELTGQTYQPERLLQPEDVATAVLAALSLPRTAELTDISLRPLAK